MRAIPCAVCGREFVPRNSLGQCCSRECGREQKRTPRFGAEPVRLRSAELLGIDPDAYAAQLVATTVRCVECRAALNPSKLSRRPELDHIVPLGVGGTHTPENLRVLCATCNRQRPKDGRDVEQETLWSRHLVA